MYISNNYKYLNINLSVTTHQQSYICLLKRQMYCTMCSHLANVGVETSNIEMKTIKKVYKTENYVIEMFVKQILTLTHEW